MIHHQFFRRIKHSRFSLGVSVSWNVSIGVLLLFIMDLGFWRSSFVITKKSKS